MKVHLLDALTSGLIIKRTDSLASKSSSKPRGKDISKLNC